jgi:hypothetical protein
MDADPNDLHFSEDVIAPSTGNPSPNETSLELNPNFREAQILLQELQIAASNLLGLDRCITVEREVEDGMFVTIVGRYNKTSITLIRGKRGRRLTIDFLSSGIVTISEISHEPRMVHFKSGKFTRHEDTPGASLHRRRSGGYDRFAGKIPITGSPTRATADVPDMGSLLGDVREIHTAVRQMNTAGSF